MYKKSVIVERADYDKDGHMVYAKFGNGTETTYAYDSFKAKKTAKAFSLQHLHSSFNLSSKLPLAERYGT